MRPVLVLLSIGVFAVNLDATVVTIALPEIGRSLGAGVADLQWIVNGYVLAVACLLLGLGSLADAVGRKRILVIGLAGFAATSIACALAPTAGALTAARVAQGAFGAGLLAVTLALVAELYPQPRERARAIGVVSGCSTFAVALGPLLGGVLVARFGWQSVFWINVPIGLITVPLLGRWLPAQPYRRPRLDAAGQLLFIAAATTLTYALIEGNRLGWTSTAIVASLAGSAVATGLFVASQRRARTPLLPPALVRRPGVIAGCALNFLGFFALLPTLFLMTLFLQDVAGLSPAAAGVRFLALTIALTVGSVLAPGAAARWGTGVVTLVGTVLAVAGFVGRAAIGRESGYGGFWWAMALVGLGIPTAISPATVAALGSAPPGLIATTSAIVTTFRQLGAVAGVAATGVLVAWGGGLVNGMRMTFVVAAVAVLSCALFILPRGEAAPARIS